MSLRVETGIGEAGKLTIGGRLTLAPLATQLEIVATSIGLGAYPPYLEDVARIDMPTGTLSASLNVEFADAEGVSASPEIAVRGRLQIDDLLTIDRSLARKFLEWESLRIEGLGVDFQDLSIEPVFAISLDDVTGAVSGRHGSGRDACNGADHAGPSLPRRCRGRRSWRRHDRAHGVAPQGKLIWRPGRRRATPPGNAFARRPAIARS